MGEEDLECDDNCEDGSDEDNPCWSCIWWKDIADHTKEYYPEMDCCAPRFDLCCTCDYQTECKEGKLEKGCVYG